MKFIAAKPNELQIDIDRPGAALNASVLESIGQTVGIISAVMAASRNGNTHWTITLKRRLPALDRIILQAALGDDPARVLLNWQRTRQRRPRPIVFFEK